MGRGGVGVVCVVDIPGGGAAEAELGTGPEMAGLGACLIVMLSSNAE